MRLPYHSNITTLIVYARPKTMFWLMSISSFLFTFKLRSRFGFKGTSFLFSHKRKREAEVDKTVVWLFYWKKQKKTKTKTKRRTLDWHFAYPQNVWQILKWQPRKVPATLRPTHVTETTYVYTNKPICWQYLAHVVLIDSSFAWLVLSVGTFFKAS